MVAGKEDKAEEDWKREYASKKHTYEELGTSIRNLLEQILQHKKIKFHTVMHRVKEEKSIENKTKLLGIPWKEMQDILGVRVITYLQSDAEAISKIIGQEFEVDLKLSRNYSKSLKTNQVGYRGRNFVVKLKNPRKEALEWVDYKDLFFEIQVLTILEYSWSEIEHDRSYKFVGELPEEIQRKFNLLAGNLELLDLSFDELCKKIDSYEKDIEKKTGQGVLDIDVNSLSLRTYLIDKFKREIGVKITPEFGRDNNQSSAIIEILKKIDIKTLQDLDKAFEVFDLEEYLSFQIKIDFLDLIRDTLLLRFKEPLLERWFKEDWPVKFAGIRVSDKENEFFKQYSIDLEKLSQKYDFNLSVRDEKGSTKIIHISTKNGLN